jgi:hypothetical protein
VKKAKVDRVVAEKTSRAFREGMIAGASEERERATRIYPIPADGMVYLDSLPAERRRRIYIRPGYVNRSDAYGAQHNMPLDFGHGGGIVLEFEPVQKNIAFSNGMRVVWFDWKPIGPYPVTEPWVAP